jgi:IclR family acetate operon transcriptional repressor
MQYTISNEGRVASVATLENTAEPGGARDVAGNKATGRAFVVLERLIDGDGSHGVSELSRSLGMTKNMVHRALTTFLRHGYVVRDETGTRYQLGPGVLRLAALGLPELDLQELCRPFMRSMRDLSGETVSLAVPWGRQAITVSVVRGRGAIARRVQLGRTVPLHVTPAARAILANFPDDGIEHHLREPLEPVGRATLTDSRKIWDEIRAVRERGYATIIGDQFPGTNGVSFPIPASTRFPHGSLTVGGSIQRLTPATLDHLLPELQTIAAELARRSALYPAEYTVDVR